MRVDMAVPVGRVMPMTTTLVMPQDGGPHPYPSSLAEVAGLPGWGTTEWNPNDASLLPTGGFLLQSRPRAG